VKKGVETTSEPTKGTVVLVEDEFDTRELLGRSVERAGYRCLATADATDALERARGNPDVVAIVTDVVLGSDDRRGLRLLADLRAAGVDAPVIVITAYADVDKVKAALNQGAAHLLEKPFKARELIDVIDGVRAQGKGDLTRKIDAIFTRSRLTEKERTVAHHLLAGLSSGEIAEAERNSPKTIRQHVSQIYAKCGVGSRAEFFRLVYRH
jgi:DNA-binding NarL/FixJ family response regulator